MANKFLDNNGVVKLVSLIKATFPRKSEAIKAIVGSGNKTISYTKADGSQGSFNYQDTTYQKGTASALGLTKLFDSVEGTATDGAPTQKAINEKLEALKEELGGKVEVAVFEENQLQIPDSGEIQCSWVGEAGSNFNLSDDKKLTLFFDKTNGCIFIPIYNGCRDGMSTIFETAISYNEAKNELYVLRITKKEVSYSIVPLATKSELSSAIQQGNEQIQTLKSKIEALTSVQFKKVTSLPTTSKDTAGVIYLMPSGKAGGKNMNKEYIDMSTVHNDSTTPQWEVLGTLEDVDMGLDVLSNDDIDTIWTTA